MKILASLFVLFLLIANAEADNCQLMLTWADSHKKDEILFYGPKGGE
jgi:hypothetical protein